MQHHAVRFLLWNRSKREFEDIDPPRNVINRGLGLHHYGFHNIKGVISLPTIRPDDFSIITKTGYDITTELFYKPSRNVTLPESMPEPTPENAKAALELLKRLLVGFPFEDKASRAAALAAIITTVARGAFPGAVPLFVVTAPDARTGKTYLVNLIALIATGRIPVSVAGAEKKEEFEKRVETAALSGRSILHLNNLPNGMTVESDRLSELATEGRVNIRKLGRHEEGQCDCRATTAFLNGNNILLAEDLVPRSVTCRLDAEEENPEERTFDFDPMEQVRSNMANTSRQYLLFFRRSKLLARQSRTTKSLPALNNGR